MTATLPLPAPPSNAPRAQVCTRCGVAQPLEAFSRWRNKAGKQSGRHTICAPCRTAAERYGPRATCVTCGGEIAPNRAGASHSTCQRDCLLQSVGLPPDWEVRDLTRATEQEIRDTLDAVILAASAGCRQ